MEITYFNDAQIEGTAPIAFIIEGEEISGKLWLAQTDFEDGVAYATCGVEAGDASDIFYATVEAPVDEKGHVLDAEADYAVEVGAAEGLAVAGVDDADAALDELQEVMIEIAAQELTAGMEKGIED